MEGKSFQFIVKKGEFMREYLHAELTSKIIKSFYNVHRRLGPGFLDGIYQNAVAMDLENNGMGVEKEKLVEIFYNGALVGNHRIDILVNGTVIVEAKAVEQLNDKHKAQVISYLRATDLDVGLLVNFANSELEFKRLENFYKHKKGKFIQKIERE